jgi:fused signal recognition particle receptor
MQNSLLEGLARNELEQQKERIGTYQIQARFALASIYDRAALGGGAVATPESGGESQGEIEDVAPDGAAPETAAPMDGAPPQSATEPEPMPPPVTEPPVTDPDLTQPQTTDPAVMEPGVDTAATPETTR